MANFSFENPNKNETSVEKKSGWFDYTMEYREDIKNFISKAKANRYDSVAEFHLSGENSRVLNQVYQGEVLPKRVEVFQTDSEPEMIHVVYDGNNSGNSLDFYISGQALDDFFSEADDEQPEEDGEQPEEEDDERLEMSL